MKKHKKILIDQAL